MDFFCPRSGVRFVKRQALESPGASFGKNQMYQISHPYGPWVHGIYLPTFTIKINYSCFGKYTSPMDPMGMVYFHQLEVRSDSPLFS